MKLNFSKGLLLFGVLITTFDEMTAQNTPIKVSTDKKTIIYEGKTYRLLETVQNQMAKYREVNVSLPSLNLKSFVSNITNADIQILNSTDSAVRFSCLMPAIDTNGSITNIQMLKSAGIFFSQMGDRIVLSFNNKENLMPVYPISKDSSLLNDKINTPSNVSGKELYEKAKFGNIDFRSDSYARDILKHSIKIYLPKHMSIELNHTNSNIVIAKSSSEIKVQLVKSKLYGRSVGTITGSTNYSSIIYDTVYNTDLDLKGTTLHISNLTTANVKSEYSKITLLKVGTIVINSKTDDYSFTELLDISGQKHFGNLKIGTLKKSLDISGSSIDIQLTKITPETQLIKINNSYGDIRISSLNWRDWKLQSFLYQGTGTLLLDDELDKHLKLIKENGKIVSSSYSAESAAFPKSSKKLSIRLECENCEINLKY